MTLLCALPLVAGLLGCPPPPAAPDAVGYVEGEHVLLAPLETAQVIELTAARGDHVQAGAVLARMEDADAAIAVDQARAALAQARAELDNMREGRRPAELRVIEATLASAQAEVAAAERDALRIAGLKKSGVATAAQVDDSATRLTLARAKAGQAQANLEVARLPARPQEIAAMEERIRGAEAALAAASWRLSKRSVVAPVSGEVRDILRRPGDIAGPQAPLIDILPDGAVKLVLYFPQSALARLRQGTLLDVRCDGCAEGLTAAVSHVSGEPEFTPPVIYSLENRQKLVFRVEARNQDGALRPGQIVDVAIRPADAP